jgi:hypothetical protein
MSDKENINQDLEILNIKLKQLIAAYDELKTLNDDDAHEETLREGFLLKAGKNTEKILKYICKREMIIVSTKAQFGKVNEGKIPMLNDYIFHLKEKKIINEDIHHHLEIIKKWRNRSAHDFSEEISAIDFIKDSTIESVNDSFNHIKNWFFKQYLKNEYPDFSTTSYSNKEKPFQPAKEQAENIQHNFEKNPFNVSDLNILSESKKTSKKKNKSVLIIFLLLLCSGSIYFAYNHFKNSNQEKPRSPIVSKNHMNKDQVYDFLIKYYNCNNDQKFDGHQFFANKVDKFYTMNNVNPTQIEVIRQTNTEYIDSKNTVDKESLTLKSKNDSVSYWQFWGDYTCYRTSKQKFQNCKVLVEFGINNNNKIISIREIEFTKPRYTKKRP